ncbi:MAG: hypothetical protein JWN00_1330 [Actinomycetia bacterium]|nr:hypothetical protein [Actinomycetes bacterium]
MLGHLLGFTAVAFLLTITPGPDTAMVLRQTLTHGRRAGFAAAVGVALGLVGWGVAAAIGLAALLASSAQVYTVFRWICGIYLVVMAIQSLRSRSATVVPDASQVQVHGVLASGRAALITSLLNPKLGVFFVAFLPEFIPHGASVPTTTLLFAGVQSMLALAWYTGMAAVVTRARDFLNRDRVQRALRQATAAVFLGFGARLLTERA